MGNIIGNDVASFQGDIDFDVYKNNSNFIIIKASEGTGFIDPKFVRNQSEARRVGLPLGYYHFARPDLGNSPQNEADWFLKAIGEIKDSEVLCLDYEPNWPGGDAVGWCKSFLEYLSGKLNEYKPLIYLNQSQATGFNWKAVVDGGFGLWIAAYTGSPTKNNYSIGAWPFAAMQQWTSSQTVPGVKGNVDGDVFFGDINTFKKYGVSKSNIQPSIDSSGALTECLRQHTELVTKLNDKDELIINLNKNISELTSQLQTARTEVGEKDKQLLSKDQTIQTLQIQADQLPQLIAERDQAIKDKQVILDAQSSQNKAMGQLKKNIEDLKSHSYKALLLLLKDKFQLWKERIQK